SRGVREGSDCRALSRLASIQPARAAQRGCRNLARDILGPAWPIRDHLQQHAAVRSWHGGATCARDRSTRVCRQPSECRTGGVRERRPPNKRLKLAGLSFLTESERSCAPAHKRSGYVKNDRPASLKRLLGEIERGH